MRTLARAQKTDDAVSVTLTPRKLQLLLSAIEGWEITFKRGMKKQSPLLQESSQAVVKEMAALRAELAATRDVRAEE